MKNLSLLLFLLFINLIPLSAQLSQVTVKDLEKSQSAEYPEAAGEILFQEFDNLIEYIGGREPFENIKNITYRIKVYDKNQIEEDFLNVKIPLQIYPSTNQKEKIVEVEASTYNLKNNKIVKEEVKKDEFFTTNITEYNNEFSFTFPNVQNGSIIEYKVKINSPDITYTNQTYLQHEIPVQFSRYIFHCPGFMQFSRDVRGSYIPQFKTSNKQRIGYTETIESYEFKDLPPIKNEPFVLNPNNIKTSIQYELIRYKDPDGIVRDYSNTWEQVSKDMLGYNHYKPHINGVNALKDIAEEVTKGLHSDIEKCNALLKWVYTNIKWTKYVGIYPENGVKKALRLKEGNVADLNLMLINLLKKSGIEAHPVLLSSLSNGILNLNPSKRKVNYVIAAAKINDNFYLMDASYKNSEIGLIPLRARNYSGVMLLSKDKVRSVNLFSNVSSKVIESINAAIIDDKIVGQFSNVKSNILALEDINERDNNIEAFEENFLNNYNITTSDYKFISNGMKVKHSFKFKDETNIQTIGNKMIIKPFSFLADNQTNLTSNIKNRTYPIEFETAFISSKNVNLKVPDGYKVGDLPENIIIKLDENFGGYSIGYKYDEEKNILSITSIMAINKSRFDPNFYTPIKELFEQKAQKENLELIFVKK